MITKFSELTSLIIPQNPKYKTLQALADRITKVDIRSSKRDLIVQESRARDLRKRSLNFHRFLTVHQQNTEIAIREMNSIKEHRKLSRIASRDLFKMIAAGSDNVESNFDKVVTVLLAKMDEIPPGLIPKLLSMVYSRTDQQSKKFEYLLIHTRVPFSITFAEYSIEDLCIIANAAVKHNCGELVSQARRQVWNFLTSESSDIPPESLFSILNCCAMVTVPRIRRVVANRVFNLLETSGHRSAPGLDHPLFSPVNEGVSRETISRLIDGISRFSHIRIPSKYRLILPKMLTDDRVMRIRILSRFSRYKDLAFVCRDEILALVRSRQRWSQLSNAQRDLIKHAGRLCGFSHRFHSRRIGISKYTLEEPLEVHQLTHDERMNRLIAFAGKCMQNRVVRRKVHALIQQLDPRRVMPETLLKWKKDLKMTACPCRGCEKFNDRLELALAFYYP
jgi:hypothetical protein